jgi:hypothetical protein
MGEADAPLPEPRGNLTQTSFDVHTAVAADLVIVDVLAFPVSQVEQDHAGFYFAQAD